MKQATKKKIDAQTHRIYDALKRVFPSISAKESDVVYKIDHHSIRVGIIDERFSDMSVPDRLRMFQRAIKPLDHEDCEDISMALVLAPEDLDDPTDLMMQEFFEPRW